MSAYGGGISKNELEIRLRSLEARLRQLLVERANAPLSRTLLTRIAQAVGDQLLWDDIAGKPVAYPPSTHTHPENQIIGLDRYTQAEVNALLSALTLRGLADVDGGTFSDGQAVVYVGGMFVPGMAGRPGITYRTIPGDMRIEVGAGEQYIVYDELVVDGELFIDGGEVVVL